jgi:hypothetical protein
MSTHGGVAGKHAKLLEQALALKNVDTWAGSATKGGQDDIARAYQTMMETLGGSLDFGSDTGSPAVLDSVRRYMEGRSADTTRFNTAIQGQALQQKNAIMLNQIAPTLDETGALVESLRMLDQEKAALRRAQYINLGISGAGLGLQVLGLGLGGGGSAPTAIPAARPPSGGGGPQVDPYYNYEYWNTA